MLAQPLDNLDLISRTEAGDSLLQHTSNGYMIHSDKAGIVHESEEAHDELAIHAICHTTVTGDGITKVLNVERALQTRSEEASKGGDERGEGCKDEDVELHGSHLEACWNVRPCREVDGKGVGVGDEHWVWVALEAGEDVGTKIL